MFWELSANFAIKFQENREKKRKHRFGEKFLKDSSNTGQWRNIHVVNSIHRWLS